MARKVTKQAAENCLRGDSVGAARTMSDVSNRVEDDRSPVVLYYVRDALEVDFMPNVIDSPARGHGGRYYHVLNRVRYLWDLPQT
jgi:hypothetical protein